MLLVETKTLPIVVFTMHETSFFFVHRRNTYSFFKLHFTIDNAITVYYFRRPKRVDCKRGTYK